MNILYRKLRVALSLCLLGLLALALCETPAASANSPALDTAGVSAGQFAPGQIVIKVKAGLNVDSLSKPEAAPAELQPLFQQLGVYKVESLGSGTDVLLLFFGGSVDNALRLARSNPAVLKADANRLVKVDQAGPVQINDPIYLEGKQWWLDRIQAREAWTITTGSKDVRVGVVDTGIDANHPDLQGKVIKAYNFAEETSQSSPGSGHGTAVAGCIAATPNNGVGISGLNWNVSLIDGKGFGGEETGFSFDLARGAIFAINQGARVINNSWGGSGPADLAIIEMAEYAASRNVIMVFSSGNSGTSEPEVPGAFSSLYPNVITVGATDINDQVTGFSTYGPQVDLVAPGSGIWTTQPGGGYWGINGTSFSAPIVTGVIALMLSVNPDLTPLDVRNILEGTADDISGQGYTYKTGYGRVNAYRAVLAAKNKDLHSGKQSVISGKVTGVDPAKVRLSLDPLGLTFKPDAAGNFRLTGLGKATYRIRAAVTGQGTAQGPAEFKLTGEPGSTYQVNFAFQNVKSSASAPDNYVDQARFFDAMSRQSLMPGVEYFEETGHTLSGQFLHYWQTHGGLAVFGYPLSEEFVEVSPTDGKLYTVQYFERNRFELHPENAGTPYEIELGLLGSEETSGRSFPAGLQSGTGLWFPQTGQNLSGSFLAYWQTQGGLAIFGYPISPVIEENGRQVQYFERNRFELHPENSGTPYEVLLGLLGRNLAQQRGYLNQ
ncbi:MAG TPA: S8 family serine peptidase [Chloroflexia bacterium]|nr:S8 family serine peptidase [Chloroflexia bacterium]